MVRMSDLVRGIVRDGSAEPAAPAERPLPTPSRRVSLDARTAGAPAERHDPAPDAAPPDAAPHEPRGGESAGEPAEPLFAELQALLADARGQLRGHGFPWGRLHALVDRSITSLARSADLFWVANNPAAPPHVDYVAVHQARVCVLALRIAAGVGYDRARLISLGLAAAVFDVGLWQLPDAIVRAEDAVSSKDLALWRSHPKVSAEIVESWGPPNAHIVQTILEHHEREQGQGFPQGLHGAAIDPDAKIIGLVDTYSALTLPPSSRRRLRPHEAIRDIVKTRNDQFPSALIKGLLSEISVFPPGTVVRLNTDEVGRVIAVNRNHPLRPKVEILADGKGHRLPAPKLLDLSEAPFLYITGPIGEGAR
jgi:hypothetical protein